MKKALSIFMLACLSSVLSSVASAKEEALANEGVWQGLGDENHHAGPKITKDDLDGKVVMGMCWGLFHPPSKVLLPPMEQVWQSLKDKPFVFVASSRKGWSSDMDKFVAQHKLTFPIYECFGLPQFARIGRVQGDPRLPRMPYFFVVDHRGSVVYSGNDMSAATEAAVNALGGIGGAVSLTGKVELKAYKSLAKQLVFGKNIKRLVLKLEDDAKKGGVKSANADAKARAEEAAALLEAIGQAKTAVRMEINAAKRQDPAKALKLIKEFSVTFPDDAAEYKAEIPALIAAAKKKAKAGK